MYKKKKDILPVSIANFELESTVQLSYNLRIVKTAPRNLTIKRRPVLNLSKLKVKNFGLNFPLIQKNYDSLSIFKKFYKSHLLD